MSDQLTFSLLVTAGAFIVIMGSRYLYRIETLSQYCICRHEFNEHYVYPAGMVNPYGGEQCKMCKCKQYNKSETDPRNKRKAKFW